MATGDRSIFGLQRRDDALSVQEESWPVACFAPRWHPKNSTVSSVKEARFTRTRAHGSVVMTSVEKTVRNRTVRWGMAVDLQGSENSGKPIFEFAQRKGRRRQLSKWRNFTGKGNDYFRRAIQAI